MVELVWKNGIAYQAFTDRVRKGWSQEKAATTPKIPNGSWTKKLSVFTDEHHAIREANGISKNAARQRYYKYGWSIEDAITVPILSMSERAKRVVEGTRKWRERTGGERMGKKGRKRRRKSG